MFRADRRTNRRNEVNSSLMCFDRASQYRLFQITNLMQNSFILQQHVCYITILNMFRARTLLILRRTNCITTASGVITLCKQLYGMQVERESPLSTCIPYSCLQRVTIPEAVVIQSVLLRMSRVLLQTC